MTDLTFEAPGPGSWSLDTTHFSGPVSRYYQETCRSAQLDGFRRGAEHYGFLYERGLEFVNGFRYGCFRPIVGPSAAGDKAEAKFQRRVDRLAETYETKRWREDLERWDTEWKPAHREINRSLRAVDPASLDDAALLDHLEDCRQAVTDAEALHVRMSFTSGIPQYDFLHYTSEWTSRLPDELLSLLDGASPDSAGAVDEFQRVVAAVQEAPTARRLVRSDAQPAEIVDRLRGPDSAVKAEIDDWLDVVGYRPVSGWDVADPYALEHPETLVRTLREGLDGRSDSSVDHDSSDQLAAVRREVPDEHRDRFEQFYEEARLTYRVRDERNFLSGPSRGLLRRALLEVGRRLAARDRLRVPDHVFDLTHDEVSAALDGGGGPPAGEVATRFEFRRTHDNTDAPDHLGDEGIDPYTHRDLSEVASRFVDGAKAYERANYPDSTAGAAGPITVNGLGASPGTAEGSARVVTNPDKVSDIQNGDILVTDKMSPGYNVVLPLIEGVVTDTGGKLSHPAIVAREYGLPAVVNCGDATDHVDDGDRIALDGESGTVRLL